MNTVDFNIKQYGLHESWRPVLVWLDEARPSFCSHFDVLLRCLDQVTCMNAEDPSSADQSPADPVGEALSPISWSYEDALRKIEGKMRDMVARMEQLFFEEIARRYGLDVWDNPSEVGYGIVNAYFPNRPVAWDNDTHLQLRRLFSLIAYSLGQEPDFRNLISEDELDRATRVGFSVPEQVLHLDGLEVFNIYADIVGRIVFVVKDEELSRRLADFPERPDGSVSQFIRQFFSHVSR